MGMIGTFDAFTTARLGIYAAQHGLRVTGNNISNLNTEGYTRQRIDQVSLKTGASDMYRSVYDNHVGNGALVTGINQIRDPYLDIRYRNTSSDVGFQDTWLAGLQQIASVLDEVGKGENKGDGLLYAQLMDLSTSLRELSKNPSKDNDNLVRASAQALASLFNTYADKLETLRQNTLEGFQKDVTAVNQILTNIRDLNESIRDNELCGDNALELRDERNRQIDKLSEYMHIRVEYTMEDLGGKEVEKLTIKLGNSNPDPAVTTDSSVLIDGLFGTQISIKTQPKANPAYDPNVAGSLKYLKPDGTATDDEAEAEQVYDDNYIIKLGKLLDRRDREWEGKTSTFEELTEADLAALGKVVGKKAIYSFKFSPAAGTQWAADDTFGIGGKTFTVGKDIPLDDANDPEKMAAFIAQKLDAANPDYTVSIDPKDKTNLLFTANKTGEVAAGNEPQVNVTNDPAGKLAFGAMVTQQAGVTGKAPTLPDPVTTDNGDGTETVVSYTKSPDNKYYKVTTQVEHTAEVVLDDNDLHGSLQATRELLTEAGSFSTTDTVDNIDENAAIKRGIPFYQKSLDLLAQKFAQEYNKLNTGTPVDQDGNPIQGDTVKQTIPEIKEIDGKVYAWNDATKEYEEKPGWGLADVNGVKYAIEDVAGKKYFTGLHGTGCNIYRKIPVDGGTEAIYNGLKAVTGTDPALAKAVEDALAASTGGNDFTDPNVVNAVTALLTDTLGDHGVNTNSTKEVDMPVPVGGPLFSNRNDGDDTTGINASNISVSHSWSTGDVRIVPKFEILFGGDVEHTTQNTNVDHMLSMIDKSLLYDPRELVPDAVGTKLFEGSFNDMLSDACTTLGNDQRIMNIKLNKSSLTLIDLDTSREGVSGVDLNDETMNMMQYQKAYSAACRLMTAIDEAIDRLINNTGLAGR